MNKILKLKKYIKEKPLLKNFLMGLWWISLLTIGFIANDLYDKYTAKSSLDIIMPQIYNEKGEFEINLINNGEVDLEIDKVKIHSCYMENSEWKYHYPDDLPQREKSKINFFDNKTLDQASLIDCINNPLKDWENRKMSISLCKNTSSGQIFALYTNKSLTMCGICFWNISVETNKKNFSFYEETFLPIDLTSKIDTKFEKDFNKISSDDFICTNNLTITLFSKRELEIEGMFD